MGGWGSHTQLRKSVGVLVCAAGIYTYNIDQVPKCRTVFGYRANKFPLRNMMIIEQSERWSATMWCKRNQGQPREYSDQITVIIFYYHNNSVRREWQRRLCESPDCILVFSIRIK